MLSKIDRLIDSTTMYRLALYLLLGLSAIAILLGFTGVLSYGGISLLVSFFVLTVTARITNVIFAAIFKAPATIESSLITACILFFLMFPVTDAKSTALLALVATVAMASKYVFAFKRKHFFNPAAFGALFGMLFLKTGAIWWVGSLVLLPFVLAAGFIMVKKIRRFPMVLTFLGFGTASILIATFLQSEPSINLLTSTLAQIFTSWPILFFGAFMLTEPMTSPTRKHFQIAYGAIVGALFGSSFHVGPFFATPETVLIIGNLFAFAVNEKSRLMLTLKEKENVAQDVFHFTLSQNRPFSFLPGQYLEWTLPHENPDNRGNRRYFTIASSPTENELAIGIKISEKRSSFKNALQALPVGGSLSATELSGDFVMPNDAKKKLVFVAGGIGVTPFRSMVKYLVDKKENRDITLFYAAMTEKDFAYTDLFKEAEAVDLKTVYVVSEETSVTANFKGHTGYLTAEIVKAEVPDFTDRIFYLSGPHGMVVAYKKMLKSLGVKRKNIKTDYFPGF